MMESREPTPRVQEALAHYRAGKEHWSRGEWREALNHYLAAIDLDPDGPATEAYRAAQQVLDFYHHDRYNP